MVACTAYVPAGGRCRGADVRVDGMDARRRGRAPGIARPRWSLLVGDAWRSSPRRRRRSPRAPPTFVQARALEINGGTVNSVVVHQRQHGRQPDRRLRRVEQHRRPSRSPTPAATPTRRRRPRRVGTATSGAPRSSTPRTSPPAPTPCGRRSAPTINAFGIVYAHEYSGLDRTNPLDVSRSAIGTAAAMTTGNATTTNANDLIFGAGASTKTVTAAGAGLDHPLDRVRQPHDGPHRHDGRQLRGDRDPERQRVGAAAGRLPCRARPTPCRRRAPTGLTATPVSMSRVDLVVDRVDRQRRRDRLPHPPQRHPGRHQRHDVVQRHRGWRRRRPTRTRSPPSTPPATSRRRAPPRQRDDAGRHDARRRCRPASRRRAISPTQVNLTWTASTDNVAVTGYDVFRDGDRS